MPENPSWNPSYESYQWIGDLIPEERENRYFVKGRAIHPCKTYHPNEWPEVRVYLEEELKASAPSLSDRPLIMDHGITLEKPNRVLRSAWEDGAVEYLAEVSRDIYDLVKSGEIRHCSVEFDWRVLEKLDGIAPRGLELTGLSLLRQWRPGDPTTSVEVWEGIVNKLKAIKEMNGQQSLEDRVKWMEDGQGNLWNRIDSAFNELNAKIETLLKIVPVIEGLKEQADEDSERERLHREQRERAEKYGIGPKEGGNLTKPSEYENVPEDQFADPVNWRYPIDVEHVKGALTYFNQPDNRSQYEHGEQVKMMAKIIASAVYNGIEVSWQPDDPVYRDLPEELKEKCKGYEKRPSQDEALRAQLDEALGKLRNAEEERDALKAKASLGEAVVQPGSVPHIPSGFVKAEEIMAILPKDVPWRWGAGPHELVRRLRSKCASA